MDESLIYNEPLPPFEFAHVLAGAIVGCVVAWFAVPWIPAVIIWTVVGAGAGRLIGHLLGVVGWSFLLGAVLGFVVGDVVKYPGTGAAIGAVAGFALAVGLVFSRRYPANSKRVLFTLSISVPILGAIDGIAMVQRVDACSDCLPRDVSLTTTFGDGGTPGPGLASFITVRRALVRLGAYCSNGVIVDRWGREIRFIRIPGEHAAGEKYERRVNEVFQTLRELKRHYTVVEMYLP
jgi:hypothetical protein